MAPRSDDVAVGTTNEINVDDKKGAEESMYKSKRLFLTDIVWPNAIGISVFLVVGFYTLITFPWILHYKTAIFGT